ncbi:MAG: antibiotic biosynthesis monooxygenase [Pseudonocardiales bacterium]|nr:MAG: antibiotic biosynthesis monooxygenase [Pseudonocardiales bacterium]
MTEVSTVAVIIAKPGSSAEVERALRDLVEASHAEPGCLHYSLHRGLPDPNLFFTVEKWGSQGDLDAHLGSSHVAAALTAAGTLLAAPPNIMPAEPLTVGDPDKGVF